MLSNSAEVMQPQTSNLAGWLSIMHAALSGRQSDEYEFRLDKQGSLKVSADCSQVA